VELDDASHSPATKDAAPLTRCAACQLQLCKSRTQEPHAGLKEVSRDEGKQTVTYRCDGCGATLMRSSSLARPGWAHCR
jgi:uncharacterized protein with PIN domain